METEHGAKAWTGGGERDGERGGGGDGDAARRFRLFKVADPFISPRSPMHLP